MKLSRTNLRLLIEQTLNLNENDHIPKEQMCVADTHPSIVELKRSLKSAGWKSEYDELPGDYDQDFLERYMPDEILNALGSPVVITTPKINIQAGAEAEITQNAIERLRNLVMKIEERHLDVKYAWVSFVYRKESMLDKLGYPFKAGDEPNSGPLAVGYVAIYASFSDNVTLPANTQPFVDLTDELAKAKGYGFGWC